MPSGMLGLRVMCCMGRGKCSLKIFTWIDRTQDLASESVPAVMMYEPPSVVTQKESLGFSTIFTARRARDQVHTVWMGGQFCVAREPTASLQWESDSRE